jgi:hypothetical protein
MTIIYRGRRKLQAAKQAFPNEENSAMSIFSTRRSQGTDFDLSRHIRMVGIEFDTTA